MITTRTPTQLLTKAWKRYLGLGLSLIISTHCGLAGAQPAPQRSYASSGIAIPDNHQLASSRLVTQDGVAVTLTRYERSDGRNAWLGGEHFSTLLTQDGELKGFTLISLDLSGKPLPSRILSEQIATAFLRKAAPELYENMRITSVAPYEKSIRTTTPDGDQTVSLAGIRVKARDTRDGSWFWVVVSADKTVMAFERDVGWSHLKFSRSSEYWLDDQWLLSLE